MIMPAVTFDVTDAAELAEHTLVRVASAARTGAAGLAEEHEHVAGGGGDLDLVVGGCAAGEPERRGAPRPPATG